MKNLNKQRDWVCMCCSALREDLYFDVGCLLALSLVHGGPRLGFFSRALYQCLFNYPANRPLTVTHMTPDTHFTRQVSRVSTGQTFTAYMMGKNVITGSFEIKVEIFQIAEAESLEELKEVMAVSWEYLELAGCNRPISSLKDREVVVEDLVSFAMITRMQLPLQR